MSITLELSPEVEAQIREAAAREGRDVPSFVVAAATEKLLTLEEVDAVLNSYAGHANDLTQIEMLDFRVVRGQKFVAQSDLERYQREAKDPEKGMQEMVGLNQLWGLYDE
mgnify:CR=1 FL=1